MNYEETTGLWSFEKYETTSKISVNDIPIVQKKVYCRSGDVFQIGNSKTKFSFFYPQQIIKQIERMLDQKRPEEVTPQKKDKKKKDDESVSTPTGLPASSPQFTASSTLKSPRGDENVDTSKKSEANGRPSVMEPRASTSFGSAPTRFSVENLPERQSLSNNNYSEASIPAAQPKSLKRKRVDDGDSDEEIDNDDSATIAISCIKRMKKESNSKINELSRIIANQTGKIVEFEEKCKAKDEEIERLKLMLVRNQPIPEKRDEEMSQFKTDFSSFSQIAIAKLDHTFETLTKQIAEKFSDN